MNIQAPETPEKPERPASPGLVGVVAIGAAADAHDSVRALLASLPAETGLAFVLVQHLEPSKDSPLPALVAKATARPVHQAEQGMPLEPDHVYVIPPNALLFLSGGHLVLEPRAGRGRTMPIDLFLRSLALEMRHQAIAVVLSGDGSDGALGMEAVKAEGGFTFAEGEGSSRYSGMTSSAVGTGCVDMVLPAAEIGREIGQLALRMRDGLAEQPVGENDLLKIFDMLRAAKGVDFTNYRHTTIRRRILRRMLLQHVDHLGDYVQILKDRPAELAALYQDVLIRVTNFFRDPEVFATLKESIFPEIMNARRPANAAVRVWVPGCATGEEAYSIAMCLVEYMMDHRLNLPIQVFATDISDAALETARAGTYVENIALDVSPERLRRFFTKVGKGYQISQSIRDLCVFARQNMTSDPPFSRLDMVSCRNVLIYLSPILQKKVLPIFHYSLKPGGFLLLGSSETTGSAPELFEVMDRKNKVFIKTVASARPTLDFPLPLHGRLEVARVAKEVQRIEDNDLLLAPREADRLALARYAPPSVIVNQDMQIVEFRGQTGIYLEPASGAPSHNLLRMARDGLALELRAAIHKAQKSGQPVRSGPLEVHASGATRNVVVDVTPLRVGMRDDPCRFYLISFEEVTPPAPAKKGKKGGAQAAAHAATDTKQVSKLKQELAATREYLQSIIEEMEATNEELQSANEEILSSNEELQSINEELETAKEELQSTNEELTTVNEELRARNAELARVNNDLNNALSSMNIPIVMLSTDLRIRRFTPMAEKVLHLIPSDVGRPLSDIRSKLDEPDLAALVAEAIDGMKTIVRAVRDREGRWYSMRIRPYRTSDNKIDGAVVAMLDSEEHKRPAEVTDGWHDYVDAAHEPILVLDDALRVLRANNPFFGAFGIKPDGIEGRVVFDLGRDGEWNLPSLRRLLQEALPQTPALHDHRLEQDIPGIGRKTFSLNVRRVRASDGAAGRVVLAFAERPA